MVFQTIVVAAGKPGQRTVNADAGRAALDNSFLLAICRVMHLAEIPQLKTATPQQKIELIDELWASIPPESLPTPDSHVAELQERMAALQSHPEKALTPEEARARIRNRTGL